MDEGHSVKKGVIGEKVMQRRTLVSKYNCVGVGQCDEIGRWGRGTCWHKRTKHLIE